MNQFYKAEILTEYVIRGNTAVLKCSIPSFVADFVHVEAWIDEDGKEMTATENYGKKIKENPHHFPFSLTLMPSYGRAGFQPNFTDSLRLFPIARS